MRPTFPLSSLAVVFSSLAVVLLAVLPASALKPKLLTVGSLPPDMTACDTNGRTLQLRSLRGKKRVVLLSTQNGTYRDNVRRHQAQFAERDVVVLTTSRLSSQFYLVGKDGRIKMARYATPTNAELFATIDAMPMRRAEMQKHT